ncbi:phage N-6-adenine-methyltransferase [Xenorhabdus hominickii]|uniref:Phage N-6-adenine-methyltransferase n=1 Tax=Xenorhabdus hominickii TaxID=351679 RepID=A0A2G0QGN6_XENHO|nr:phage N-6-adenine-methyltransferase [Xenorhabdus hominickii]AOM42388.1 phage N-6-adenine-methyltransferase [Xenorhabdus hominickii]PHM58400.1 phage N-6-adenine-methyltransferase [Xenorhabdus hominickii]
MVDSSVYLQLLQALKEQSTHKLADIGDQWCTPDEIFWGINAIFGPLVLDLFSDGHNAKCSNFYTAEDNALTRDWSEKLKELGCGAAFANPPYSRAKQQAGQHITGMTHIMNHARAMRAKFGRYVFLIKAATSETWWPEQADHVAFIRGRIGFDLPTWFVPADEKQVPTGAFFAGAVVVLDKQWQGTSISYIDRDELIAKGKASLSQVKWRMERGTACQI